MNNLSWFLYAVDVINSIGIVVGLAAIALGFATIMSGIGAFLGNDKECKKIFPLVLKIFIPIVFLSTVIPDERTMYLILGSEIGEEVIQSETAKKVHDVINKKLDEYLEMVE